MRFIACSVLLLTTTPVLAGGYIESACLTKRSDHPVFCACTQAAADRTLSSSDQRTAAKMILEPDLFYDWADSGKSAQQAFIDRYKVWGNAIQELCALEG